MEYKCILQVISDKLSILYSFKNGKFYLINNTTLPEKWQGSVIAKEYIYLSEQEFVVISNSALNPETVGVKEFNSPMVVGLMVWNSCNLECRYCIARNGGGYSANNTLLNNCDLLIERLVEAQVVSILISGGEPTLNDNLCGFLERLSDYFFLMMIDTNGVLMSEELLGIYKRGKIIPRVSVDSIKKEIHNINRGKFENTLLNINRLLDNNVDIRINTVLYKDNAVYLEEMAEWLVKKGIKKWHIFKVQKEFAPQEIWIDDAYAKCIIDNIFLKYSEKINIICKFSSRNDSFSSFVIDNEGNCFSTDNDNKKKVVFGNIIENSISEIWSNTPDDYKLRHYKKHLSYKGKKG